MKKNKIKIFKNLNKPILIITLIYAIMGVFLILDASSISSILYYKNPTPYFYFEKQLKIIFLALGLSLIIIRIPTKSYKFLSLIGTFTLLGFLIIALFKGFLRSDGINEVKLSLFNGGFQPAEFLKIFLVMYMSSYYGSWVNSPKRKEFGFVWPLLLAGGTVILIFIGGDWGTACIMTALFALLFLSLPCKDKWVVWLKGIAVFGLIIFIVGLKFGYKIVGDEYEVGSRWNRLIYKDACDRYYDDAATGYQVCNGYIAIDNGGLKGVGIGASTQKYLYLPESHTDFIFAIIVEEFGSIIASFIIVGYMLLLFFIFKIAKETNKLQNSMICYGIGIHLMLHIFINLGGVLGLIPVTGVPLPFLSYGGTFILVIICSFAVVQRINIENQSAK